MAIYRGPGGSGDATGDAANQAALAIVAASEAQASATASAASATTASTQATNAANSASSANTSATSAGTSASNASISATSAATSATNASTSASAASTSATNAATSESNTASLYDQFDDRYLGSKSSDPTLDNDGSALLEGALYWNSTSKILRVYNGTTWEDTISSGSGSGTVTSVDMTVPTGLQVSGNPITTSGTLAVTYQSGYSIPTSTKQGQWDTAYSWGDHSIVGYLDTADIGATVQAYDADLTTLGAGGSGARSFLGLTIGTDVQAYDVDTTKNDVANTFTANQVISVTDNSNAALRVTQLGTGDAFVVEDSSNPDSTSFVINASGNTGVGAAPLATDKLVVGGSLVALDGGFRVYSDSNKANNWLDSTGTTSRFQVGYNPSTTQAYIQTVVSAPLLIATNSVERVRFSVNGGVSFGSAGTAFGTSGQVLQSNGDAAPTWTTLNTGGMTLLGTLTTTSGSTQTLSGLTLTDYVELEIIYNNVSTTTNSVIRINGQDATAGTGGSSGAIRGIGTISLVNGTYQGNGRPSDNTGSQYTIYNTGVTTASTSITFTTPSGTFDAGSILVYGVK